MEDFDVSIFIVDDENQYINFSEIMYSNEDLEKIREDINLQFVVLTNDILNSEVNDDNTICISRYTDYYLTGEQVDHRAFFDEYGRSVFDYIVSYRKFIWQADNNKIDGMRYIDIKKDLNGYFNSDELNDDLNGYKNTQTVLSQQQKLFEMHNRQNGDYYYKTLKHIDSMFPSLSCAYKSKHTFQGKILNGYMPAIGQLQYISHNMSKINAIFSRFGIDSFPPKLSSSYIDDVNYLKNDWWSSSQQDNESILILQDGKIRCANRIHSFIYTLPLFKIN